MYNQNKPIKYSEDFKRTIVNLYQSGKTYSGIQNEYGISSSALANWIKKYSKVQIDDNTVLTAQQIKDLQKRNAELEEENLILKKTLQSSLHTQTKTRGCKNPLRTALPFPPLPGLKC